MCGRYVQASSPALLAERFAVTDVRERAATHEPDYNVTPRREVPVVAGSGTERVLDVVRWGLVPPWAKDLGVGDRMINARAETIADKPAYRKAFAARRAIVPADAFYEWRRVPGSKKKQPYLVHRVDGEPLALAGIWERWRDPEDPEAPWVRSCAIVTTAANATMRPVHDRMPAILPASAWDEWLDPDEHDVERLQRLLVPAPDDEIALYPVSPRVNRPASNDAGLLARATREERLDADLPEVGPANGET